MQLWATFRPTKYKFHYVAPQFYIFRRTVWIAPNFLHWNAHIFLFGLILRDIPNSITPQTTLRLLPIPVGLLVIPCTRQCRRPPLPHTPSPFVSCPGQRNRRRPVPVPVTGVRYNSLLWMCALNTLIWPDQCNYQMNFKMNIHYISSLLVTTSTQPPFEPPGPECYMQSECEVGCCYTLTGEILWDHLFTEGSTKIGEYR